MNIFNKVIKKLIKKDISLSIAESCTGGLLSAQITKIPNVSKIFNLGLVVYSNKAKSLTLNIPIKKINKYGAVSSYTCKQMLIKLYSKTHSKICISTTGIAGPGGETKNKPVGLVFIGIRYKNKNIIIRKKYSGSRIQIQNKTVKDIINKINNLI